MKWGTLIRLSAFAIASYSSAYAAPFSNNQAADLVLGQTSFTGSSSGTAADLLDRPTGVAIDPTTGKVFVCDSDNNRILRFSTSAALTNGAAAEAVLGQGTFTTMTPGTTPTTLFLPAGICIDSGGRLWVADTFNNRVLRFDNASSKTSGAVADGVLGQGGFFDLTPATTQVGMRNPNAVSIGPDQTLWVADSSNHRVLRFDNAHLKADGANADGVLGQAVFTTMNSGLGATAMNQPTGLFIEPTTGRLWVADQSNHRVLRFENAASRSNGAFADGVLGQSNFINGSSGLNRSAFFNPLAVAVDRYGTLYVADGSNARVLWFDRGSQFIDGNLADGIFGQADFNSAAIFVTASSTGVNAGAGFAFDSAGRMFLAQGFDSRVTRHDTIPFAVRLTVNGPLRRTTSRASIKLRGTASSPAGISKVDFDVSGAPFRSARGTTSWSFNARLRNGENAIRIRARAIDGGSVIRTARVRRT